MRCRMGSPPHGCGSRAMAAKQHKNCGVRHLVPSSLPEEVTRGFANLRVSQRRIGQIKAFFLVQEKGRVGSAWHPLCSYRSCT